MVALSSQYNREYKVYLAMKRRCFNAKDAHFKNYGGRGIIVCDRWAGSFSSFFEDMGKRPSDLHSLERLDNNGNYEPSNVVWATKEQQQNNMRSNRLIEFNGEIHTISQWSSIVNMSKGVLYSRFKSGWDTERALTQRPGEVLWTKEAREAAGRRRKQVILEKKGRVTR